MITLGMFIDWIRGFSDSINNQGFYPGTIKWVAALPSRKTEASLVLEPGLIVVCNSLRQASEIEDAVPIVVICDFSFAISSSEIRHNTLLVNTSFSLLAFTAVLQKKILAIAQWEHNLDRISAERGSYQDMLDASKDVLGNLVTLSDSTYHLIAYTHDMPTDDPITNELIEKGFHGERAIVRFRETGAFSKWAQQKKTHYSVGEMTKYPSMNHVFTLDGAYFIQMVMTCSNVAFSQGLLDTFDILVFHIKAHIRRCQKTEIDISTNSIAFFSSLLEGKVLPRNIIAQQLRSMGLSGEETIRLFAVKTKTTNSDNLGYLARLIKSSIPSCVIVQKNEIVYIVAIFKFPSKNTILDYEHTLLSLVDSSCVDVAASGTIPTLSDLHRGAQQINIAYKYGKGRSYLASDKLDKSDKIYRFENALFDYLLFEEHRDMGFLKFCLDTSILARLKNNCRKEPSDFAVLRCYLKHECSATVTAAALGLHRNTILNRIEHISQIENIDFFDPKVRINLTVLFHLSDYFDSIPIETLHS